MICTAWSSMGHLIEQPGMLDATTQWYHLLRVFSRKYEIRQATFGWAFVHSVCIYYSIIYYSEKIIIFSFSVIIIITWSNCRFQTSFRKFRLVEVHRRIIQRIWICWRYWISDESHRLVMVHKCGSVWSSMNCKGANTPGCYNRENTICWKHRTDQKNTWWF